MLVLMCFNDAPTDTLHAADLTTITDLASRDFPAHDIAFERNSDGMVWAVLKPRGSHLPRLTICRIDPCIMVLVEDAQARRQIRSLSTVAEALDFGRRICAPVSRATSGTPSRAVH